MNCLWEYIWLLKSLEGWALTCHSLQAICRVSILVEGEMTQSLYGLQQCIPPPSVDIKNQIFYIEPKQ